MTQLEKALMYFADFVTDYDVPVGIIVTSSGRFLVRRSLSESSKFYDTLDGAASAIVREYKHHVLIRMKKQ